MNRLPLLALAVLLTGCTGPRNLIGDALGYVECSEVPQPEFIEHVVPVKAITDLEDAGCEPPVAGCSWRDKQTCEIWYTYGDELTRRHECTHCVRGKFHP